MNDCPFCNQQEISSRSLQESEHARVLFSNPRLVKGHLLVTPKRHVEEPWNLTEAELNEIFTHIHVLQKRISQTLGTGCDIRQNYRPFLIQGRLKIDHLHFHLIPRSFEDELYQRSMRLETALFTNLPANEISEVTQILQSADLR